MAKKKTKGIPREDVFECVVNASESGKISFSLDDNGDLVYVGDMESGSLKHTRFYQGKNKSRTLSRLAGESSVSLSQEVFLLKNYEKIYFIDTNDSVFRGKRSCCTIVLEVESPNKILESRSEYLNACLSFVVGYHIFDVSGSVHGEKIGWHLFIEGARNYFSNNVHGRILIITDHDLGAHDEINKREKPYYLNYYLPLNVSLGYAKSDKRGSLAEFGMNCADSFSNIEKEGFKRYENSVLTIQKLDGDDNYRGFIIVLPPSTSSK